MAWVGPGSAQDIGVTPSIGWADPAPPAVQSRMWQIPVIQQTMESICSYKTMAKRNDCQIMHFLDMSNVNQW